MQHQKNNKEVITLLIIIVLILSVLYTALSNGIIGFKSNEVNDNKTIENNIDTPQNNTIKNFYDISDLKVKALKEYSVFDNISNNTNITESISIGDKYYADLDITGKVRVKSNDNDNWITGDLNINNVVDIIKFDVPAPETEQLLYLLTDSGDVYCYKFGEVDNKNYAVIKAENISNVQKLFISHFSKENAGGSWALFAITKSNDCIMIIGESV